QPDTQLDLCGRAAGRGSAGQHAFLLRPQNVLERKTLRDDARSLGRVFEIRMRQVVDAGTDLPGKPVGSRQVAAARFASGGEVALSGEGEQLDVLSAHVGLP